MDIIRYIHAYFLVLILICSIFGIVGKTNATSYEYDQNSHLVNEYTSSGDLYMYDYDLNGNLLKKSFYNNLALNKPSTAESYIGTNLPSKANDADQTNNGYWGVDLQGSSKWWKVDLEDVYEVKKVVVRNYVDGTRYYKYKVEASIDGSQWTEIVNKSDDTIATDQGESYTINSINARYLRVIMLSNSANTGVHITDFRVYGDHASLALNKPSTAESYSGTNLPSKANDADQTNNGY